MKTCRKGIHQYDGSLKGCPFCHKESGAKWQAANLIKRRESSRKWQAAHPAKKRAAKRRWFADNPAKMKEIRARRAAAKWGAEGTFTSDQLTEMLSKQDGRCPYCFKGLDKWSPDHMLPMSRGGSNWIENIQIICSPCNDDKNNLTHGEYLAVLDYRRTNGTALFLTPIRRGSVATLRNVGDHEPQVSNR